MKDYFRVVRQNFTSPIVIAILVLALILLILNETRDALFISVVIMVNTLLAIVQEIRAMYALKKLELMSAPRASRIIDDELNTEEIMFDELCVGDNIIVKTGDEVPADCKIISSSGLEVDESILTGESAPIDKPNDSIIYAASAVNAGKATAEVLMVGNDTKVGQMSKTLKRYVPHLTPLQLAISRAISFLTYGALFLAALIFAVYYLSGQDAVQIFKTITSAAVVVVPEGLLLASSLLLAFGSLKLAQAKVLPQKIAAIEAMALLDVLCVDKTGTLTSDEIVLENIEPFDARHHNLNDLVTILAKETSSGSATGDAILKKHSFSGDYEILQTLAFSSARKMSGIKLKLSKKFYNVLMGAPEFLEKLAPLDEDQKKQINELTSDGKRVLLVAMFDGEEIDLKNLKNNSGQAVGLIVLANDLRVGVHKTVSYLQQNGVQVKVISGDNPKTVQYIAEKVGIRNHHRVITGAELAELGTKDWDRAVAETTIFARVLPEQKERLVDTFKKFGFYTGMVGDGVNDALALKKSNLGVAMQAGASATRRVADIILLDNSFNSLPMGMKLGNKIMQAIEIIATLFFHKITYGVILLLITLSLGLIYPFEPRHISFMNIFLVTMPTVMWTIFNPLPRHRLSPKFFWKDTLMAVVPIAFLSGLMVTASYVMLTNLHPGDSSGVSTTTVIIATFFGIYLVFLVPRMFDVINNNETRLARLLYVVVASFVIFVSFGWGFARDFFDFTNPAWQNTWPLLLLIICVAVLQWNIANRAGERLKKREP